MRLPVCVGSGMRVLASSRRIARGGTPISLSAAAMSRPIAASWPVTPAMARNRINRSVAALVSTVVMVIPSTGSFPGGQSREAVCRAGPAGTLRPARSAPLGDSKSFSPVHVREHTIERVRRRDVEIIALGAAEHDVGADLGYLDLADQRAVGVEAVHAVIGCGPEPAAIVETHAVEAARRAVGKLPAAGKLAPFADIEHADMLRLALVASARAVDNVKLVLVSRKSEPVWADEVIGNDPDLAGCGIDAKHVVADLRCRLVAFVVRHDPVRRVGEPDRTVRLHHHVVR